MLTKNQELALKAYAAKEITLIQGADLAGLNFFDFQALLRDNKIPQHYSIEDFEEDLATIRHMEALRAATK